MTSETPASLACVISAHTDPVQVRRLIAALDPFPVYLHCDRRTDSAVFATMVQGLPDRCTVLPRLSTGWARWENVEAELAGYRAGLDGTDATHFAFLTGADYPLASTSVIAQFLSGHRGLSLCSFHPLPYEQWGRSGGLARLRYRHWVYRKHMIRVPLPRRMPSAVTLAGGSQLKILARHHVQALLDVVDHRPDLRKFWRRSWIADETFVASILSTPSFVPDWSKERVPVDLWWIGWDGSPQKSPPWLGMEHLNELIGQSSHAGGEQPRLFARKFATAHSTDILDSIDEILRRSTGSSHAR